MRLFSTLLSILAIAVLAVSCHRAAPVKYPIYKLAYAEEIPDSALEKYRSFVKDLTQSASYHLTGGDIEDQEDVIHEAERVARRTYQVMMPHLVIHKNSGDSNGTRISIEDCSPEQKALLLRMMAKSNRNLPTN